MSGYSIDHFVLTVADAKASLAFYATALGIEGRSEAGRFWLELAGQKINLHEKGREISPHAAAPTSGGGDFCLVAAESLDAVMTRLAGAGVTIEVGPVPRQGALGSMRSVYFRDPDGNLVEVCEYPKG